MLRPREGGSVGAASGRRRIIGIRRRKQMTVSPEFDTGVAGKPSCDGERDGNA
jgi:hypothetical protein